MPIIEFIKKNYLLIKNNLTTNQYCKLKEKTKLQMFLVSVIFIVSITGVWFFIFPPANFPINEFIRVSKGDTVSDVASKLKEEHMIKSPTAFKLFVKILGGDTRLMAGTYFFKEKSSVIKVAMQLTNRFLGYTPYRITILEGMSNDQIAKILSENLPSFSAEKFLAQAEKFEGKLFPDTYFFSPMDTESDIIFELNNNFKDQINKINNEIKNSGRRLDDIIIMASIIEREASKAEDRRLVSGILWKRLAIEMPLQVDAVFAYYIPRNTFNLTKADLKSESAYNTYKNKGLPPTPIANPGLDSILATIEPKESPYLYYLSDRQGNMYYAETYEQHLANKRKYLDN